MWKKVYINVQCEVCCSPSYRFSVSFYEENEFCRFRIASFIKKKVEINAACLLYFYFSHSLREKKFDFGCFSMLQNTRIVFKIEGDFFIFNPQLTIKYCTEIYVLGIKVENTYEKYVPICNH